MLALVKVIGICFNRGNLYLRIYTRVIFLEFITLKDELMFSNELIKSPFNKRIQRVLLTLLSTSNTIILVQTAVPSNKSLVY